MSVLSAPFLLGFDALEERVDRLAKSTGSYPPFNIERCAGSDGSGSFIITVAVAGFAPDDLEVVAEDNQLVVHGRQKDEGPREFLHRGIAARQFQRSFLLADGVVAQGATLKDGMLVVTVMRPPAPRRSRRIEIGS